MDFIYIFGFFVITMYLIQVFFSVIQTKHFNSIYVNLKKKGRVLIGKKKGYLTAGTIVMLLLNDQDIVVEGYKMQGLSVFSRFKKFNSVKGVNVSELDRKEEWLLKENKLTRNALSNAKENYIKYLNEQGI